MNVRLIFLDVDGVLNSNAWYDGYLPRGFPVPRPPLDPAAVGRLDRIVRATNAYIVLSTSWRGHPELPGWLLSHGCRGTVVGQTPVLPGRPRGDEIAAWLNRKAKQGIAVAAFCILDDGDDMGDLSPWLIQTTQDYGLQDDDVERAITLLTERHVA